jgi:hypothetical protein
MCLCVSGLYAQSGGKSSFNFINLPAGTYGAAMGGINNLSQSNDPNAIFYNPASIHKDAASNLALSYTPFLSSISNSNVAYTNNFKSLGLLSFGLQYLNYGSISETDETGNIIGSFQSRDFAFLIGKSHTIGMFTMGASLKFAGSNIGSYSSYATMVDAGGVYKHPVEDLSVGLVVKNLGVVMKNYLPDGYSSTPFDVQVSGKYKPAHMPFRFNVSAVSLTNYDSPENSFLQVSNATQQSNLGTLGQIDRHFIIGAEALFTKNFHLMLSYNLMRRQLLLNDKNGFSGASIGVMVKLKAIQVEYGLSFYSKAIAVHNYTININTKSLFTKRVKGPIEI